jgi:hypothetical protein
MVKIPDFKEDGNCSRGLRNSRSLLYTVSLKTEPRIYFPFPANVEVEI